MKQVDLLLQGDRLSLSRMLTQIENNLPEAHQALDVLFKKAGSAHIIGITGATGCGKSTLVNQLAKTFRNPPEGETAAKVAILAIDPTSPFTGGAVLGDRVRMRDHSGDNGIFIRSVAARGSQGGVARTTGEMVTAFDAAGFDIIFVETVGAGQADVDITRLAHTVLLVENPGMGDDIQAIKAGILEIAHVIAINKADRPGVEQTEQALRGMLAMSADSLAFGSTPHHILDANNISKPTNLSRRSGWQIPVIRTIAIKNEGILNVAQALRDHHGFLKTSGLLKSNESVRMKAAFEHIMRENLFSTWLSNQDPQDYSKELEKLYRREVSPTVLSRKMINSEKSHKILATPIK